MFASEIGFYIFSDNVSRQLAFLTRTAIASFDLSEEVFSNVLLVLCGDSSVFHIRIVSECSCGNSLEE